MKTLFLLLLSCVSCLAQFGVEQPIFQLTSTDAYPAENLLLFWAKSDFGGSNNVYGTTLTNEATIDYWYYKTSAIPALLKLDSSGAGTDPTYYTNGPNGYPYFRLLGGANSYFAGQSTVGISDVTRPTMFIVCRLHEYGGITRWNVAGGTATWAYLSGNSPYPTVTLWDNGTPINSVVYNPTNQWQLFTIGLQNPNQGLVRLNGVTTISNAVTSGIKLTYDASFAIGYASAPAPNKLIDVVEIRAYTNGLQFSDMLTIENKLMLKYGISSADQPESTPEASLLLSYDIGALNYSDGTAISNVPDTGPYSLSITCSPAASRPYWTNDASLNGDGWAQFDGSNDYLTNNFTTIYPQPLHVFIVANGQGIGAVSSTMWSGAYVSGDDWIAMWEFNNTGVMNAWSGAQLSVTFADSWTIWETCFNGQNSFMRTNNVIATTGNLGIYGIKGFHLGNNIAVNGPFKGGIAWVGIYTNKLTSLSASNLVQALGTRYGITTYTRN